MLQNKVTPRVADYRAEIERYRAQLVSPRKPAPLQAAIHGHRAAREKARAVGEELRQAIAEFRRTESTEAGSKIDSLSKTLAGLEAVVRERAQGLAAARTAFQPLFTEQVLPPALALRSLTEELIDLLDEALQVSADAHTQTIQDGLLSPAPLARAPVALQHVHAVRGSLSA